MRGHDEELKLCQPKSTWVFAGYEDSKELEKEMHKLEFFSLETE